MFDVTRFLLIYSISDISGQLGEFSQHFWNLLFPPLGDVEGEHYVRGQVAGRVPADGQNKISQRQEILEPLS